MGWIGVDLDGTLSLYPNNSKELIGPPIDRMVLRVKHWITKGITVKICTARAAKSSHYNERDRAIEMKAIEDWCLLHIGVVLPITNEKDYQMIELWDDRAVQVIPNTGKRADGNL